MRKQEIILKGFFIWLMIGVLESATQNRKCESVRDNEATFPCANSENYFARKESRYYKRNT